MDYTRIVTRPDPRLARSWCGEGVAHDHQACGLGSMWDSSDPRDREEAARWAAEEADHEQPAAALPKSVLDLIESLTDPEECWFDHHGGCQAHGYLSLKPDEKCPQQEAKDLAGAARARRS